MVVVENLVQLLERAAVDNSNSGITFLSSQANSQTRVTYANLLKNSQAKAVLIRGASGITKSKTVLLHFDSHEQNIQWFWAVVLAGYLPVMSPPFTNNVVQHQKHLTHLKGLLQDPVVLTSSHLSGYFTGDHGLNVQYVEFLKPVPESALEGPGSAQEAAVLMLTSGSTGNAKAVVLKMDQILSSVQGKSHALATSSRDIFLNWIGLDHVAALLEVQLYAMWHGAEQFHMPSSEVIADPLSFLRVVNKFRISFSFAPNFFLAKLELALANSPPGLRLNLSSLRVITSGGEANSVGTAVRLLERLREYGAPQRLIYPGFGMTETCAGCIYNSQFPEYEATKNLLFGSLGHCCPGIKMRVRRADGTLANPGEAGMLEVSGATVFDKYYNNVETTAASFTQDGWFSTGDLATLDDERMLNLTGRVKDTLNTNGVKYSLDDIEAAIEEARLPGVTLSSTKVFATSPENSATEAAVVVYEPSYPADDAVARANAHESISRVVQIQCSARPREVLPLPADHLEKSSLGKLSRAKIRTAYEQGQYKKWQDENDTVLKQHQVSRFKAPARESERIIRDIVVELMGLNADDVGVSSGLLEMGVSSVEVIKFKKMLQDRLDIVDVPMITILTSPTIEELADAIDELAKCRPYCPVVVLNNSGSKLPLWLVHPGAGEILVYLNLAKQITDRPLYALRARGFDNDEKYFESIPELVDTYYSHIKRVQPVGPYVILGYSFGSMFAAELSKKLLAAGEEVKFTGVLNLPPHVQYRIRQLNMVTAILTLALFLGMIDDDDPDTFHPHIDKLTNDELLDEVIRRATPGMLEEAGLDRAKFMRWAEVSNSLHMIAWDYVPEGKLPAVDVFVAHPLKAVARNKEEWFNKQIIKWNEFSETAARFHDAAGKHFTMIDAEHVPGFAKQLRAALQARGA